MNQSLRSAMHDAGLSPRQLAVRVGVASKTIERWVADENLIPHARNRADAAEALKVDEEMLWPQAVKNRLKTGGDLEIVRTYPYRSACPSTVWRDLVASTKEDLFFAGYTNYFLFIDQPNFVATLRKKLESGCRVRFLLGNPEGETTRQREAIEDVALSVSTRIRITLENLSKLGGTENLETRFSISEDAANHVSLSVFRFDSQALVTPHLARLVGHDSPLLHLRRRDQDGLFERFTEHAEELWSRATPVGF